MINLMEALKQSVAKAQEEAEAARTGRREKLTSKKMAASARGTAARKKKTS